jgi:hypothetical protein
MRTATDAAKKETKLNKTAISGVKPCKSRKPSAAQPAKEGQIKEGIRLVDDPKTNRMQVIFKDKPEQEVRDALKKLGFLWDPRIRAWKRFRNPHIFSRLQEYLKNI